MSLPNYLANIKSSGIYRFVWDKSEIEGVPAEVLRLVVGYSEKGPFNTPVYVKSEAEFKAIYGDISKKMEKRGIFFHRLALQCLAKGPILALNLKKFENETVDAVNFNVDAAVLNPEPIKVESIYDTTRFWKLDPEAMTNALTESKDEFGYISLGICDTKETSKTIFIRGYKPNGYDVTIKNWYALTSDEVPEYFAYTDENGVTHDYSSALVSDFWAEVFVFNGKFTPAVCASEPLNKYFDIVGNEVQLKPYIENAFGEKIDTLTALSNESGSNFVNSYAGCLLPYFKSQSGAYVSLDLAFNADNSIHSMMMNLDSDALYNGDITIDQLVANGYSKENAFGFKLNPTVVKFDGTNYTAEAGKEPTVYSADMTIYQNLDYVKVTTEGQTTTEYKCTKCAQIVVDFNNVYASEFVNEADEDDVLYEYNGKTYKKDSNGDYVENDLQLANPEGVKYYDFGSVGITAGNRIALDNEIYTISTVNPDILIVFDTTGQEKAISIAEGVTVFGHFPTITTTGLKPVYFEGYTYENAAPVYSDPVTKQAIDKMSAKLEWQKGILSALTEYEGIRTALTNRTDIDYRYIVDTFEAYIDTEVHKELALIAKDKDNAIAFINFPSMKSFKDCTYTKFTDSNNKLQTKYIVEGGNKQKGIGRMFTLVSELNGASFVSYNTPFIFSDGTVKTIVPSAGLVSNNFMDKHLGRQPYYIVAGPNYGKMTYSGLVGPEYNFTRADLDLLEPFGVNAMVYVPRIGTYINSNQTAKQNPVTALSKINVRELVIYIQDEIEKLLQNYQWEFNTPYLRDLIKAKADTICERVKNNNGLYQYLNVCDTSNNTDDVINNEMLVLSTSIEPGMGAGKMVQELTIYRKGSMSSVIK